MGVRFHTKSKRLKKIIIRSLLLIIFIALAWGIRYAWISFPLISGFDAKHVCTCVFVSNRTKVDLDTTEMSGFPFSLANYKVNTDDSSVTASVWGMATKKAIYRKSIGCTLINDVPEKEVRSQVFNIRPVPVINTDSIQWPYGDMLADSLPSNIDAAKLKAAVDNAFTEPYPDKKQRTRAVVVVYDGQLVAEKYAPGFDSKTKMYGWSMAKSFTGALIGTLVQQNKLDIKQPAPVPEWQNVDDRRHSITIENLLQQTSGLDFLRGLFKGKRRN
jgi:hypothetical protein